MIANNDKIRFYYNFHKKTFSIQKKVEGRWLVIKHSSNFMIADAEFKVSESGRQRVLKEKVKNVHAYVYGKWVDSGMGISAESDKTLPAIIKYNPYKNESFVCENLTRDTIKVATAMCVKVTNNIVSAAYLGT